MPPAPPQTAPTIQRNQDYLKPPRPPSAPLLRGQNFSRQISPRNKRSANAPPTTQSNPAAHDEQPPATPTSRSTIQTSAIDFQIPQNFSNDTQPNDNASNGTPDRTPASTTKPLRSIHISRNHQHIHPATHPQPTCITRTPTQNPA